MESIKQLLQCQDELENVFWVGFSSIDGTFLQNHEEYVVSLNFLLTNLFKYDSMCLGELGEGVIIFLPYSIVFVQIILNRDSLSHYWQTGHRCQSRYCCRLFREICVKVNVIGNNSSHVSPGRMHGCWEQSEMFKTLLPFFEETLCVFSIKKLILSVQVLGSWCKVVIGSYCFSLY